MVIQVFTCAFYMIERKGGLSLFIDDVDFYNKIIVLVFFKESLGYMLHTSSHVAVGDISHQASHSTLL